MHPDHYEIYKNANESYVHFAGIDFGSSLRILRRSKKAIIAYCPGSMGWASIGKQSYNPPHYYLIKLVDKKYAYYDGFSYTRETKKEVFALVLKKWEEM